MGKRSILTLMRTDTPVSSKDTRKRTNFYAFFSHWATDRDSAISAVVAGSIAGGIMTSLFLFAFVSRWIFQGFPQAAWWLGAAASAACATYATWKHSVLGPAIGLMMGVWLTRWLIVGRHDAGIAIFAAVPFVCGFVTAGRGVVVLNRLAQGAENRQ